MTYVVRRDSESPLRIEVDIRGAVVVLEARGRLDIPLDRDLLRAVDHLVEVGGYTRIVLECSGIEYLSSRGVSAFIAILDDIRARGGDLKLAGVTPQAALILNRLGALRVIQSFSDVASAMRAFETPIQDFLAKTGLDTFVSSARTDVFHSSSCALARRLRKPVEYPSKKEARKAGKRPCQSCCPGEWNTIVE